MIDGYNRNINYLRISITDRCNLRCSYCMPKEGVSALGHEDVLRYEEISRIVKVAVSLGIAKVRITGGEPLVRRGVVDFIAGLAEIPGLTDISLTTNGILLVPFAGALFTAGIKRINISLDSLNEDKYARITRGGELNAVLRGIEAAHQAGFYPIKINVVVIKGVNDDEIIDFARLTLLKPFQIRFIELMPMGQAGLSSEDRYISNEVILERINKVYRLEPGGDGINNTDGPARMYKIEGGIGKIGFISPISHLFCESCNRLRLTADGRLRACLLQDKDVDLKDALRDSCDDRELQRLISGVIAAKPGRHELNGDENHVKKCSREMSSIGG
jgi:cyclic pyranopterin phosphate synthase